MSFHSTSPPHKTSFPQTQEDHPPTSHLQGNSRWVAAHFTCFLSFSSFFLPSPKPPRDWPPQLLVCYNLPLTSISILYPSGPSTSCFRPQPWPTNSRSDFAYQFIQQVDHSYSTVRSAFLLLDSTKSEGTRSPHHQKGRAALILPGEPLFKPMDLQQNPTVDAPVPNPTPYLDPLAWTIAYHTFPPN